MLHVVHSVWTSGQDKGENLVNKYTNIIGDVICTYLELFITFESNIKERPELLNKYNCNKFLIFCNVVQICVQ